MRSIRKPFLILKITGRKKKINLLLIAGMLRLGEPLFNPFRKVKKIYSLSHNARWLLAKNCPLFFHTNNLPEQRKAHSKPLQRNSFALCQSFPQIKLVKIPPYLLFSPHFSFPTMRTTLLLFSAKFDLNNMLIVPFFPSPETFSFTPLQRLLQIPLSPENLYGTVLTKLPFPPALKTLPKKKKNPFPGTFRWPRHLFWPFPSTYLHLLLKFASQAFAPKGALQLLLPMRRKLFWTYQKLVMPNSGDPFCLILFCCKYNTLLWVIWRAAADTSEELLRVLQESHSGHTRRPFRLPLGKRCRFLEIILRVILKTRFGGFQQLVTSPPEANITFLVLK